MNRIIKRIISICLLVGSMNAFAQSNVPNMPGKLVDVGGYKLHFNIEGSGPQTIVIEPGTGSWSLQWMAMQDELAKHFKVVTYDRAGYGWSQPSPYSRSADVIAEELHLGLTKAGLREPIIFLGHSYGGLIAKTYSKMYPDAVKALIFADAATEHQFEKLPEIVSMLLLSRTKQFKETGTLMKSGFVQANQIPIDSTLMSDYWSAYQASLVKASYYDAMYNEMSLLNETYRHAKIKSPSDKPVLVITAGNSFEAFAVVPNLPIAESNKVWDKLQKGILEVSSNSEQKVIKNATHDLLLSAPNALRDFIVEFVKKL